MTATFQARCLLSFNSKLVRLEVEQSDEIHVVQQSNCLKFQFQTGSIRSLSDIGLKNRKMIISFQFQTGSIRREIPECWLHAQIDMGLFQFQTGSIRSRSRKN